jgi:hypothetical protein
MRYPTHEQQARGDLLDDAYDLGMRSGEDADKGSDYASNPYPRGSEEWREWWMGWHAGREEDYA